MKTWIFTTMKSRLNFLPISMCSSLVWLGVLFNTDLFIVSLVFHPWKYKTNKIKKIKNENWRHDVLLSLSFRVINYLLSLNNLLTTFISLERLWKIQKNRKRNSSNVVCVRNIEWLFCLNKFSQSINNHLWCALLSSNNDKQ